MKFSGVLCYGRGEKRKGGPCLKGRLANVLVRRRSLPSSKRRSDHDGHGREIAFTARSAGAGAAVWAVENTCWGE